MSVSTRVLVPNGVLFITDIQGGDSPQPVRGARVLSTPSCIGFACEFDSEGETDIWLGPAAEQRPVTFWCLKASWKRPAERWSLTGRWRNCAHCARDPDHYTRPHLAEPAKSSEQK